MRIDKDKLNLVLELFSDHGEVSRSIISERVKVSDSEARIYKGIAENIDIIKSDDLLDEEVIAENVKLAKQKQKYQDSNRIERKSFREYVRVENALTEFTKGLTNVFDENPIQIKTIKHNNKADCAGVLHLTDTHFNELVELSCNRYDFNVASKRMKKFVEKARQHFLAHGVNNVFFAMTSDLINSDRRIEELMAMATNRSKAVFLAVQIIENMIVDLNKDFNIHIASVTGNESRVGQDIGWQHQIASDNYDFTIYSILEYHMKDMDGIYFLGGDSLKKVVNIAGYNWLLIHGHQSDMKTPQKGINKLIRQYSDKGISIRFLIMGHIHECLIADLYARGSSPVGANAYSEDGLLLTSRASQNIHIQYSNGEIDSIKCDLQEVKGTEGYPIQKELEAYNAKSASKINTSETIVKIVV